MLPAAFWKPQSRQRIVELAIICFRIAASLESALVAHCVDLFVYLYQALLQQAASIHAADLCLAPERERERVSGAYFLT